MRTWPADSTSARTGANWFLADAKAGKFDCVLVWKLDRFGRSLVDCLNNIRTLDANGIRLIAVTQGRNTIVEPGFPFSRPCAGCRCRV